jgi:predicted TIM-barrel fold metal-dependent hydrolase
MKDGMRVVDCHVHLAGPVPAAEVVAGMDGNGVDRILVISRYERDSPDRALEHLREAGALLREAPDRIGGLAWLNPAMPRSGELAERALADLGFSGIKIIPDHWFAWEDRFAPFWKRLDRLSAGVLFHTGILYAFGDGSRFCRPVFLEKLLHYPRIRFAMAHLSWPWCDECLAVMGRMRAAAEDGKFAWQSWIDTTPGTPPYIRRQAVRNALDFCGPDRLLFGSDSVLPGSLSHQREVLEADLAMYREYGLADEQIEGILSGNALGLFPAHA